MKISVVIPARNRAKTLPACLDSVLRQTLPPNEVIVVDDGSTDETFEVAQEYSDRRVRCIRLQKSGGAQAARNYGIRNARFDWIAFQDSDDLWLPNKLQLQVEALKQFGYDNRVAVHGNGLKLHQSTGVIEPLIPPLTEGSCYKQLLLRPSPMFQGLLVSKYALTEIGGLDDECPSYQEWETAIRLSAICQFVHLQQPLFQWVWHDGETISKDIKRDIRGYQYVTEKYKKEIISNYGTRRWRGMKAMNIARALGYSLWDEVKPMIENEPLHPLFTLAALFARYKMAPRGTARLLRLAAL